MNTTSDPTDPRNSKIWNGPACARCNPIENGSTRTVTFGNVDHSRR